MSTYTDLNKKIKETIVVNYNDRVTPQEVKLFNENNEYWGTFHGKSNISDSVISNTTLSNVVIDGAQIKNTSMGDINITEIGEEIDGLKSDLENTNNTITANAEFVRQQFEEYDEKLESMQQSSGDVATQFFEIGQNIGTLSTTVNENYRELNNKIDSTSGGIYSYIAQTETGLIKKIETGDETLDTKINTVNDRVSDINQELNTKINTVNTDLNTKIDTVNETLSNRIEDVNTTLNSKIDTDIHTLSTETTTRIDSEVSQLHEKIDLSVDTINNALDLSVTNLTDKINNDVTKLSVETTNRIDDEKAFLLQNDDHLSVELRKHTIRDRHYSLLDNIGKYEIANIYPYKLKDFTVNELKPIIYSEYLTNKNGKVVAGIFVDENGTTKVRTFDLTDSGIAAYIKGSHEYEFKDGETSITVQSPDGIEYTLRKTNDIYTISRSPAVTYQIMDMQESPFGNFYDATFNEEKKFISGTFSTTVEPYTVFNGHVVTENGLTVANNEVTYLDGNQLQLSVNISEISAIRLTDEERGQFGFIYGKLEDGSDNIKYDEARGEVSSVTVKVTLDKYVDLLPVELNLANNLCVTFDETNAIFLSSDFDTKTSDITFQINKLEELYSYKASIDNGSDTPAIIDIIPQVFNVNDFSKSISRAYAVSVDLANVLPNDMGIMYNLTLNTETNSFIAKQNFDSGDGQILEITVEIKDHELFVTGIVEDETRYSIQTIIPTDGVLYNVDSTINTLYQATIPDLSFSEITRVCEDYITVQVNSEAINVDGVEIDLDINKDTEEFKVSNQITVEFPKAILGETETMKTFAQEFIILIKPIVPTNVQTANTLDIGDDYIYLNFVTYIDGVLSLVNFTNEKTNVVKVHKNQWTTLRVQQISFNYGKPYYYIEDLDENSEEFKFSDIYQKISEIKGELTLFKSDSDQNNFVHKEYNETIKGIKTFVDDVNLAKTHVEDASIEDVEISKAHITQGTISNYAFFEKDITNKKYVTDSINTLSTELSKDNGGDANNLVHRTGNETISGVKTFTDLIQLPGSEFGIYSIHEDAPAKFTIGVESMNLQKSATVDTNVYIETHDGTNRSNIKQTNIADTVHVELSSDDTLNSITLNTDTGINIKGKLPVITDKEINDLTQNKEFITKEYTDKYINELSVNVDEDVNEINADIERLEGKVDQNHVELNNIINALDEEVGTNYNILTDLIDTSNARYEQLTSETDFLSNTVSTYIDNMANSITTKVLTIKDDEHQIVKIGYDNRIEFGGNITSNGNPTDSFTFNAKEDETYFAEEGKFKINTHNGAADVVIGVSSLQEHFDEINLNTNTKTDYLSSTSDERYGELTALSKKHDVDCLALHNQLTSETGFLSSKSEEISSKLDGLSGEVQVLNTYTVKTIGDQIINGKKTFESTLRTTSNSHINYINFSNDEDSSKFTKHISLGTDDPNKISNLTFTNWNNGANLAFCQIGKGTITFDAYKLSVNSFQGFVNVLKYSSAITAFNNNNDIINKKYVDDSLNSQTVKISGDQEITGIKTFNTINVKCNSNNKVGLSVTEDQALGGIKIEAVSGTGKNLSIIQNNDDKKIYISSPHNHINGNGGIEIETTGNPININNSKSFIKLNHNSTLDISSSNNINIKNSNNINIHGRDIALSTPGNIININPKNGSLDVSSSTKVITKAPEINILQLDNGGNLNINIDNINITGNSKINTLVNYQDALVSGKELTAFGTDTTIVPKYYIDRQDQKLQTSIDTSIVLLDRKLNADIDTKITTNNNNITLNYDNNNHTINLGIPGRNTLTIDCTNFIKDSFIESGEVITDDNNVTFLRLTLKTCDITDSNPVYKTQTVDINVTTLIDIYTTGDTYIDINGRTITLKEENVKNYVDDKLSINQTFDSLRNKDTEISTKLDNNVNYLSNAIKDHISANIDKFDVTDNNITKLSTNVITFTGIVNDNDERVDDISTVVHAYNDRITDSENAISSMNQQIGSILGVNNLQTDQITQISANLAGALTSYITRVGDKTFTNSNGIVGNTDLSGNFTIYGDIVESTTSFDSEETHQGKVKFTRGEFKTISSDLEGKTLPYFSNKSIANIDQLFDAYNMLVKNLSSVFGFNVINNDFLQTI